MTPAKYLAALSGLSAIAKKVLEMVPIQEAWSRSEIAGHLLRVTKSSPDAAVIDGCLGRLKDSGLIREPSRGRYQRVEVREREVLKVPIQKSEEAVNAPVEQSILPIEILSKLAERARAVATELVMLASDIETAALTIEQGNAENAASLEKLRQFQSILKSLA
ncbi:hypothetical protein SB394_11925 [Burkholderia sp. BCCIQ04A]|uniref:Uncharacterized protein n=1 Tax=Burkholderia anthinoferrum TaxID=3090833 RepID=A0ABU5WQ65_9BURK|nr:hypothetical protein [Burkholderia anthinoferrum]MEB2504620.1 hypothetical protein [Burkholderia anthinoferrum]MEB2530289.1 hypothetical protein [Burkholderia anthinoferrum]MEB2561662.1 hypothetical protein [Burkholderia anthinoferrum]MEB2580588.1 hypothetical protein [Burkholderia anthinoferrum]MEB2634434.1 hypothetical protein [Burkholderia anthinoferrum]